MWIVWWIPVGGAAAVAEIFGDELFYAELPRGRGILLESFQYLAAPVCRHGFVRYRWAVFAPTAKFIESNWLFALPPSPPHLIIVPLQGDDILITMIILWSTTSPVPLLKTCTVGRNNGSSSWGNFLLSRFSTFFAQVFSGKGRSLEWEAFYR